MKTTVVDSRKTKPASAKKAAKKAAKAPAKKATAKAPKEAPLTPPADPARALNAKPVILDLDTSVVHVSPRNPRQPTAKDVQELATAIHAIGQSSTALVRPFPGKKGHYELAAGARRRAACAFLGIKLRCEVRDMTDDELADIILTDNLQREDPDPLAEAELVEKRLKEGAPESEIAARYGKTVSWVHRRARLSNLSADTIKAWRTGSIQHFTIEMLEIVASWKHAEQRENLRNLHVRNLKDLREWLKRQSCDLKGATFLKEAHTAIPGCGTAGCAQSSEANPHLFGEMEGFKSACGRCLNSECFNKRKRLDHQHKLDALTKDLEIVAIYKDSWDTEWPSYNEKTIIKGKTFTGTSEKWEIEQNYTIRRAKTPKEGEKAAILSTKNGIEVVWLTPKPLRKGQKAAASLEAPMTREEKLTRRRWALVRPEFIKAIHELTTPTWTSGKWLQLLSVFGSRHSDGHRSPRAWQAVTTQQDAPAEQIEETLWQNGLKPILISRLESTEGLKDYAADNLPREMGEIASLLSIDLTELKKAADLQLPPPKSWGGKIDVHTLEPIPTL